MDGHGLSIEGGRATRCHGRVQKRLGTRYRNAGVSWWGEGERRYVSSFPFPLPLPLPLSLSLSLCLLSGDRFVLKQSTLAFAQDDKAYRLVGRIDVARDRASIRSDRVYLPASGWWLLRNFVLRDIRQGNESSSFRRTNANGETNGVRGDEFESCKGLSFFSRSLIKTCWT